MKSPLAKTLLLFLLLSLEFQPLYGQTAGETFLKDGIGARAAGMGGAFSAVANDGSALYYNPAGLANLGLGLTWGNMDAGQKQNDFTYSLLKLGYFGYSEARLANPGGDRASMQTFGLSDRWGWLNWGLNYKNQNWNVSGTPGNGWTADIGFLMRVTPQLKASLVAQDILTSKERLVPASARVGLAFRPLDGQLLLAADGELYHSGLNYGHLGIEAKMAQGLTVRAGLDKSVPTVGTTLDLSFLSFDYAAHLPPNGLNTQQFEFGFKYAPERDRPFSFIKPKEFALVDIGGAIQGGVTEFSILGGVKPGLDSLLEQIRNATKDPAVEGIFVRLAGFDAGLGGAAAVQELRAALLRAKEQGKKVVVYVEGSALGDEYYLASVADRIVAAPGSFIGGLGRSVAVYRFTGLFQKLGIEWQIPYVGKYKQSFDWLNPGSTPEQKEMLQGLVADLYRQMITDIAGSRQLPVDKVKIFGDGRVVNTQQAKSMGLIDQIGYLRDAARVASGLCGGSEEVKLVEPQNLEPEEVFFTQVFGVAVIEVNGEMTLGYGGQNFLFGGTATGSDKIVKNIRQAADDNLVRGIILRIDSGGGSAIAAGEIYQALQYAREKKKVIIASLGSIAASGGYYIATAADKIVADPGTVTGSIGIIGYFPVFSSLLGKIGVTAEVYQEGKYADMFSGLRKFTTAEAKALSRVMDEGYDEFINSVAAGRRLATAEVKAVAEGRVMTGQQALEVKLVDQLGGFMTAVDLAKQEAEIVGEPRLIYYRDLNPWLQAGQGLGSALGLPPLGKR